LASKSAARAAMLKAAGLDVRLAPADIDERALDEAWAAEGRSPADIARLLAEAKASAVSGAYPGTVVIGADQTLALGDRRFTKPVNREEARAQLQELRGKTHALHSAVTLVQDGSVLFKVVDTARLTMRPYSDKFLDFYLDAAGATVTESVGAYQLEKLGIHLFEKVEGDYFTILGMPMLPLLAHFRREKILSD
jgi:septum formation protein